MFRCSAKTCDAITDKRGYCPACRTAYKKAWDEKNPGYHTEKKRQWVTDNPERHQEIEDRKYARRKAREGWQDRIIKTPEEQKEAKRLRWHNLDPVKRQARRAVRMAIKNGTLVRGNCSVCGVVDVEAHHTDYSKPLEVQWLCKEHHLAEHGKALKKVGLFD
jgi:hypothetical protein